jgi:hypothetical protein
MRLRLHSSRYSHGSLVATVRLACYGGRCFFSVLAHVKLCIGITTNMSVESDAARRAPYR